MNEPFAHLQVKGLANLLKTNLERGIRDDDAEIVRRRNVFGANTYPQKKGRSFWVHVQISNLLFYSMFLNCNKKSISLCLTILGLPLGSLPRFNSYHSDGCCSLVLGAGYKDRGKMYMPFPS